MISIDVDAIDSAFPASDKYIATPCLVSELSMAPEKILRVVDGALDPSRVLGATANA